MKNIVSFMWVADRNFWGEAANTNKFWASLCVLFSAFLGVYFGGASILSNWFDFNIVDPDLAGIVLGGLVLWSSLVAESIICSDSVRVILLRSLWTLMVIAITMTLSAVAAMLFIVIIVLFLVSIFLVFWQAITGFGQKTEYTLSDGTKLIGTKGLTGEESLVNPITGKEYAKSDSSHVRPRH